MRLPRGPKAIVFQSGGTYYLHYDGAGPRGWLACLATSKDLVHWAKKGPILDFGKPGEPDSACACSPWVYFDGTLWHMFYVATPFATPPPERIPAVPYLTCKATSRSPGGPWIKQKDLVPFRPKPGTFYSDTANSGYVVKHGDEYLMFFHAAAFTGDAARVLKRTLGIARTKNLDGLWQVDPRPVVPPEEQIENSSLYFEPANQTWFLFTNHIGIDNRGEYTDGIWVYWSKDLNRWDPQSKAVVLDGRNCSWSKDCIGMPTVIPAGRRLALLYDAPGGKSVSHVRRSIGLAWLDLPLAPPGPGVRAAEAGTSHRVPDASLKPPAGAKMIGMYIHQHWPYNHPYAARTWTLEDWRGYADGLHKLGYNAIMIWPMLETMPDPLASSDRAYLEKTAKVIDMLHGEFGMRVWLALCPNVSADDQEAAKATTERRHFFYCDTRVNPADPAAMRELMARREKLLRPLAKADAVSIIDSDPGGYPGSTNAEFVGLLGEHRRLFDRLRPGIELVYWMHVGWEGYGRFYRTGKFSWGTEQEHLEALTRLKALNPEPWGIANGLVHAKKLGLQSRVVSFSYGRIEGEPSFPMTNFGGEGAYQGGKDATARGLMGNAPDALPAIAEHLRLCPRRGRPAARRSGLRRLCRRSDSRAGKTHC